MIIATPEAVAYGILKARMQAPGLSQMTIIDVLRFDHIVFDEFHTIGARGMGLCAAIAKFATLIEGSARLTFLSATPIDVCTTLVDFGIDPAQIVEAKEIVITGNPEVTGDKRAIHGDVHLSLVAHETPCDALEAHLDKARACLEQDRQIVLIYDTVKSLQAEKTRLGRVAYQLGFAPKDCLAISSIDDSVDLASETSFQIGRERDPLAYRFLAATSSIEMGVTFRAGLIVMDPGHDPASFVQRVGRVARGDESGSVVVCTSKRRVSRDPWLRTLTADLSAENGIVPVGRFLEIALRAAREAFLTDPSKKVGAENTVFRALPNRAVWCAALFWAAMEIAAKRQAGVTSTLRDPGFRPERVKRIHALLTEVAKGGENGRAWRKAFLSEALKLRAIAPRVRLIAGTDSRSVPWHLYAGTPEFLSAPTRYAIDRRGNEVLEVLVDPPIEAYQSRLGTEPIANQVWALFPHQTAPELLPERTLVSDWLARADRASRHELRRPERRKALEAAAQLVRCTHLIPEEPANDAASAAGIV